MRIAGTMLFGLGLLSAACGSVSTFADAGDFDASQVGTVNVTTLNRCLTECTGPGEPAANIEVFVIAPDGTLRDSDASNATGQVSLDVRSGDSVTAIYPDGGGGDLTTFVGVEPGDNLTFDEVFFDDPVSLGEMTVNVPVQGGATNYAVFSPCGSTSSDLTSFTFELQDSCAVSPMTLGFVARDVNFDPIAWGRIENVIFTAGGSTTLAAWQPATTMDLGVTGLPAEVTTLAIAAGTLQDERIGYSDQVGGAPTDGAFSGSFPWPPIGEDAIGAMLNGREGEFGSVYRYDNLAASATSYNPSPVDIPWLGPVLASASAGQVVWTLDGTGTYDVTYIQLGWNRSPPDGGSESFRWNVILPADVTEFEFPALPASHERYMPNSDDDISQAAGQIIDFGADDTYDDVRRRPESDIAQLLADFQFDILPFELADSPRVNLRQAGRGLLSPVR